MMRLSLCLLGAAYFLNAVEAMPCDDKTPVCGTDGKTYKSICHLERRQKLYDADLQVLYYGRCFRERSLEFKNGKAKIDLTRSTEVVEDPNVVRESQCPVIGPVCGSDDRTYDDVCSLSHNTVHDPSLHLKHFGQCRRQNYFKNIPDKVQLTSRRKNFEANVDVKTKANRKDIDIDIRWIRK